MEHVERSTWLNSVLSPRPVVVAGTHDADGACTRTVVLRHAGSTALPYLTASLSIHKDKRPRTRSNLRQTGTVAQRHAAHATRSSRRGRNGDTSPKRKTKVGFWRWKRLKGARS